MKHWWLFLIFWTGLIQAQVNFRATTDKTELTTEDRLKVEFTLNEKPEDFTPARFDDFYVLMGPFTSSSFQMINGKTSYSFSYGYILQPKRAGKLTIGPAEAVVNGKVYRTQPIEINVVKPAPGFSVKEENTDKSSEIKEKKDLIFRLELTKTKPYVGEAVGGVYKLYVHQNTRLADLQQLAIPEYEGFWKEVVSNRVEGPEEKIINGEPYSVYTLGKVVLFPQRSGVLKIKPYKISLVKLKREKRYFGPFVEYVDVPVNISLSSGTKLLRVKPLPENKPEDFGGAVGIFEMDVQTDREKVRTGEPMNIEIHVAGTGNFNQFELPALHLSEGLEVYEPETKTSLKPTLHGLTGYVRKTYTIIPQEPGKYKIPALRFSFFNPKTGKYETLTSKEFILEVDGKSLAGSAQAIQSGSTGSNYFYPIFLKSSWQKTGEKPFYGSGKFYFVLVFLLLLFPLIYYGNKWGEKYKSNTELIRQKTLEKNIQNLLKSARENLGNKDLFYGHLEKALMQYFKKTLKLDMSDITKNQVQNLLKDKNVPEDLIIKLTDIWNKIESIRYTPVDITGMEEDYNHVKELLKEMDKYLRR